MSEKKPKYKRKTFPGLTDIPSRIKPITKPFEKIEKSINKKRSYHFTL